MRILTDTKFHPSILSLPANPLPQVSPYILPLPHGHISIILPIPHPNPQVPSDIPNAKPPVAAREPPVLRGARKRVPVGFVCDDAGCPRNVWFGQDGGVTGVQGGEMCGGEEGGDTR